MSLSALIFTVCTYVLQRGKTALHYGAEHGHVSVVEGLISAGANVNDIDFVSLIYDMHHNE